MKKVRKITLRKYEKITQMSYEFVNYGMHNVLKRKI